MGSKNPERHAPSIIDRDNLQKWAKENWGWAIGVQCRGCSNYAVIGPGKIRHRFVRRIGDLKARLYCGKCECRYFDLKPHLLRRRD